MMAHGVMCKTQILPCIESLTWPLQQDAITSIPQVVHASTYVQWVCFTTCV